MLQTTLSVPLDVKPESAPQLEDLVEEFRQREDTPHSEDGLHFATLIDGIPTLHFFSMSIFRDPGYDPIFVIEVNCDGAPGPFWAHLEVLVGEDLRAMVRCCKRPLDRHKYLYDAITQPGATESVIPYLEAMTQPPSVFHHGNRGLPRDRITNEAALFRAVRKELDGAVGANSYFVLSPAEIHERLRETLMPEFQWLATEPPARITKLERARDIWRLVFFATVTMFAFVLPGMIFSLLVPLWVFALVVAGLAALFLYRLWKLQAKRGTEVETNFSLQRNLIRNIWTIAWIFGAAVVGLAIPALILTWLGAELSDWLLAEPLWSFSATAIPVVQTIALGVASLAATLPGIVLWLRWLEQHDSSQYMANIDPVEVAAMVRREDWVSQNHMGSIVHIRPGILRMIIIKAGHRGLGLLLRVTATEGYLGSMRTVHFAHWAFLNNSSRLLFFSNFDQSWGAYLDDFIEKAHSGLTLAWGCGVGFPPTRFLIYDGASHGRLFKNWALASRTVSRFWVSAYPELSVDQIERNYRVANGLRARRLSSDDATTWVRDL